jgi:hypothetical protein
MVVRLTPRSTVVPARIARVEVGQPVSSEPRVLSSCFFATAVDASGERAYIGVLGPGRKARTVRASRDGTAFSAEAPRERPGYSQSAQRNNSEGLSWFQTLRVNRKAADGEGDNGAVILFAVKAPGKLSHLIGCHADPYVGNREKHDPVAPVPS